MEVNSTFYRFPERSTLESWCQRTPEGFDITLKAHRLITHMRRFGEAEDDLARQYELADVLGERLGCILFQLPPDLEMDMEWLRDVLGVLDREHRNVLEFRHPSWWTG